MGTALALLFHKAGVHARLWSRDPAHASGLARDRVNQPHLPGIRLPDEILVTGCAREAVEAVGLIVAAIPSSFLRGTLSSLADRVPANVPFLSVVKGIENGTFAQPSRIIVETTGERLVVSAQRAEPRRGAARGLPASVVVAGQSERAQSGRTTRARPSGVSGLHESRRRGR